MCLNMLQFSVYSGSDNTFSSFLENTCQNSKAFTSLPFGQQPWTGRTLGSIWTSFIQVHSQQDHEWCECLPLPCLLDPRDLVCPSPGSGLWGEAVQLEVESWFFCVGWLRVGCPRLRKPQNSWNRRKAFWLLNDLIVVCQEEVWEERTWGRPGCPVSLAMSEARLTSTSIFKTFMNKRLQCSSVAACTWELYGFPKSPKEVELEDKPASAETTHLFFRLLTHESGSGVAQG